jgi:hypothetical protein
VRTRLRDLMSGFLIALVMSPAVLARNRNQTQNARGGAQTPKAAPAAGPAPTHFHYDHVANANAFAGSTWLVRKLERDIMFADPPSPRTVPAFFSALKTSKTVIVKDDEYDVFGDKSVIIKSAPGHSPDHQVLFLRLPRPGPC